MSDFLEAVMRGRSVGLVAAALVVGTIAAAQTPGASNSGDIMPALLQEVRGLRTAIELMTASSSRVQLALGRLQLQEQRLAAANSRLAEARNQLSGAQRRAAELQERITYLDSVVSGAQELPRGDAKTSPEETRKQIVVELRQAQHEMNAVNGEVTRLTNQENMLANEVSAEQARWSDFNQRLEELERSLRPVR